jgi:hypothetical protein
MITRARYAWNFGDLKIPNTDARQLLFYSNRFPAKVFPEKLFNRMVGNPLYPKYWKTLARVLIFKKLFQNYNCWDIMLIWRMGVLAFCLLWWATTLPTLPH